LIKIKKLLIITEADYIRKYLSDIDEDTIVIGWNEEVCQQLERIKIRHKPMYVAFNEDISVRWMKQLAIKKIHNENLISLFKFEQTSLWWWMEYWLYVSYAYDNSFNDIIKAVHCIYTIIRKEKPDKIVYIEDGLLHAKTIRLIADHLKIETLILHVFLKRAQFRIANTIKLFSIWNYFFIRLMVRKWIFSFMIRNRAHIEKKKQIMYVYQNVYIHDPLHSTLEILKKTEKICSLNVSVEVGFINFREFWDKLKDREVHHILLEDYVSRKDMKFIRKKSRDFGLLFESMKTKPEFRNIFSIYGINIWLLIEPQFLSYFRIRLKHHLINFIGAENVIESSMPQIVLIPTETTELQKGLFLACQKRSIPTIAVQHGIISEFRCIHEKGEISLNEIKPRYCPIPSITAVYGKEDKKFLIKRGKYPYGSVVVTGNPRYDILANTKNIYDKEEICKELNLNPHKKILVVITDPFPEIKNREILISSACNSVKQLSHNTIQLIIKVHPREDLAFYEKIVKQHEIKVIVTKYDVFKTIFISDAVITTGSTAGLEAAILDKAIIYANFIRTFHGDDFIEKGIALDVKKTTDLTKSIMDVLYDKNTISKLKKKRGTYVYEHCFKIDGKASLRIAELVKKYQRENN
jgi:UDP-N-acetylglucosamine 2-epimerase